MWCIYIYIYLSIGFYWHMLVNHGEPLGSPMFSSRVASGSDWAFPARQRFPLWLQAPASKSWQPWESWEMDGTGAPMDDPWIFRFFHEVSITFSMSFHLFWGYLRMKDLERSWKSVSGLWPLNLVDFADFACEVGLSQSIQEQQHGTWRGHRCWATLLGGSWKFSYPHILYKFDRRMESIMGTSSMIGRFFVAAMFDSTKWHLRVLCWDCLDGLAAQSSLLLYT